MHDDDVEHGHELDDSYESVEGVERYAFTSVGVDIGSSTSHVVLSRLTIRRRGGDLSTQFEVSDRQPVYIGPPILTPYDSATSIDVEAVESFVAGCYRAASLTPSQVATGAVVVTGEAMKKHNAGQIAEMLSRWCGEFVCVSAGPRHEGMLAAHGSGSVALSKDENCTVVNVDVGGGTTKVSLIENGEITHVEAFSVGARLVVVDAGGTVTRLEQPALVYAAELGIELTPGASAQATDLDAIAGLMADVVLDAIVPGPAGVLRRRLMLTPASVPSWQTERPVDHLVFSGGVAEYVDRRETSSFGDLGPALGRHLRDRLDAHGLTDIVSPAAQGIRATVLGASQWTVQASGQTCFVPDESILPVRNLPVVPLDLGVGVELEPTLRAALTLRELDSDGGYHGVAIELREPQDYAQLRAYGAALVDVADGGPVFVLMKNDLARALGRIIADELGHTGPLVVLDGIEVGAMDYLDIGRPLGETRSFPVTVKSLMLPVSSAPKTLEESTL